MQAGRARVATGHLSDPTRKTGAIVYNFSPRYFAGATLVMSNTLFDDKAVTVNQNKWVVRAFVGMRLWK